jgi:photosystem II stability/assembly factor-like uncharacterized protein
VGTKVVTLIGTKNGAFLAESDGTRREWSVRGPFCQQGVRDIKHDAATNALYAAGSVPSDEPFSSRPVVWKSTDLGETWTNSGEGISYGADGPEITRIWGIQPAHGSVYAGVEPAGLFRSDDEGATWTHVVGLRKHPTCPDWGGGAGGLCLHTIVPHPTDPRQLWIGMSAVGVFYTADGGETWEIRNGGKTQDYNPGQPYYGFCCHKLVRAPGEQDRLYQQDHGGVYRSSDGGRSWDDVREGLSSDFGFACAAHPRDVETAFLVPIQDNGRYMPGGSAAVWRTRDAGDSWQRLSSGLPQEHAYFQVLREALATDTLEPAGVYFGTNSGWVFGSHDEGESWTSIASFLPYVWAVNTAVVTD